jgi:hypothetical protein
MAPEERGPVLNALAPSIKRFDKSDKATCLAQIRKMSTGLPAKDKHALLNKLLRQCAGSRASDDDSKLSYADPRMQWEEEQTILGNVEKAIARLMLPPVSSEALEGWIKHIAQKYAPYTMAICAARVVNELHRLDADSQSVAMEALSTVDDVSFLGALFQSNWMRKISALARQVHSLPSALFVGALEGDSLAGQQLLVILSHIDLPRALYLDLCSRIAAIRKRNNHRIEAQSVALLTDVVLLADMPEASKCLLVHRLHVAAPRDVHRKLCSMHASSSKDSVSDMHRVIASCIDIGACHAVANRAGDGFAASESRDAWRLPYSERANVVKPSKSKGQLAIDGQGVDADKAQLRKLLCGIADVEDIKTFVHQVLDSDRSLKDKIAVLEGRTEPLPSTYGQYESFSHMYYDRLKGAYCDKWDISRADFPDYSSHKKDEKRIDEALATFSRGLPKQTVQEYKEEFNAVRAAFQQSRLPALQVAILTNKASAVGAYVEAVLDYYGSMLSEDLPLDSLVGLLEFRSEGKPAFYTAITEASPKVIASYVHAVLSSRLPEETKIDILDARSGPGRFGGFYVAMSSADKGRVSAFMTEVLESKTISSDSKANLLRCQKDHQEGKEGLSPFSLEKWKRSPETALAAATEKAKAKNAASAAADVVDLYKKLVGDSDMDAGGKKWALCLS